MVMFGDKVLDRGIFNERTDMDSEIHFGLESSVVEGGKVGITSKLRPSRLPA